MLLLPSLARAEETQLPPPTQCVDDLSDCRESCRFDFGTGSENVTKAADCAVQCKKIHDACLVRHFEVHEPRELKPALPKRAVTRSTTLTPAEAPPSRRTATPLEPEKRSASTLEALNSEGSSTAAPAPPATEAPATSPAAKPAPEKVLPPTDPEKVKPVKPDDFQML
jgi:hypothetical protein